MLLPLAIPSRFRRLAAATALAALSACVDRLPDQDLRILSTTPAAKMSVDLLWQEFKADPAKAARQYHGHVVEITGHADAPAEGAMSLNFAQPEGGKVVAALLAERAAAVAEAAKASPRITIRCFVEGRSADPASATVLLKSCVLQ